MSGGNTISINGSTCSSGACKKIVKLLPDTNGDSSSNSCHQNYRGPSPLSDPESLAVKQFISTNKKSIKLFISLHSYGQVINLAFQNFLPKYLENIKRKLLLNPTGFTKVQETL